MEHQKDLEPGQCKCNGCKRKQNQNNRMIVFYLLWCMPILYMFSLKSPTMGNILWFVTVTVVYEFLLVWINIGINGEKI